MSDIKNTLPDDSIFLNERLQSYSKSGCYSFHILRHKRASIEFLNPYSVLTFRRIPGICLDYNADLVIQSLHKALPCLTQRAQLHVNSDCIDQSALENFLSIRPFHLLMISIEQGIRFQNKNKDEYWAKFIQNPFLSIYL